MLPRSISKRIDWALLATAIFFVSINVSTTANDGTLLLLDVLLPSPRLTPDPLDLVTLPIPSTETWNASWTPSGTLTARSEESCTRQRMGATGFSIRRLPLLQSIGQSGQQTLARGWRELCEQQGTRAARHRGEPGVSAGCPGYTRATAVAPASPPDAGQVRSRRRTLVLCATRRHCVPAAVSRSGDSRGPTVATRWKRRNAGLTGPAFR